MMYLQEGEVAGVYLADMGEIDDMERSHLIFDKDTQMVYDSRKEVDLIKLEKRMSKEVTHSGDLSLPAAGAKKKKKPWGNHWKKKRENNEKFLFAAEMGDIETVITLLDTST